MVRDEHGNPLNYDNIRRWNMVSQPKSSDGEEQDTEGVTSEARMAQGRIRAWLSDTKNTKEGDGPEGSS